MYIPLQKGSLAIKIDNEIIRITSLNSVIIENSDTYDILKKDISEARDIYVSLINDMKNIFKFLSKNKDKWNIEDDTIVFENDKYLNKYNELIEKIGKIEEKGQNI